MMPDKSSDKASHLAESALCFLVQSSESEGTEMASSMIAVRHRIIFDRLSTYEANFAFVSWGHYNFGFRYCVRFHLSGSCRKVNVGWGYDLGLACSPFAPTPSIASSATFTTSTSGLSSSM
jgi:hypothetical protein